MRFSASDSEALKREYVASSLVAVLAETDKLAAMDERPLTAGQADRLWRALDRYSYGPLPVTTVGQWLWDVARFRAPLAELESLLNGGAVTQDQFKARLAAPDSAEKEEEAKAGDREDMRKKAPGASTIGKGKTAATDGEDKKMDE